MTALQAMLSLDIMTSGDCPMAQLTVRNLSGDLVRSLRVRAAQNGRSAEAEHRLILDQALKSDWTAWWERVDAFRSKTKKQKSDSAQLLREMRDSR